MQHPAGEGWPPRSTHPHRGPCATPRRRWCPTHLTTSSGSSSSGMRTFCTSQTITISCPRKPDCGGAKGGRAASEAGDVRCRGLENIGHVHVLRCAIGAWGRVQLDH
jgi:hypothetical protein